MNIINIINEEIASITAKTIEQFYAENNINPDNLSYLGSGDFGEAYSTGDDRVVKTTSSDNEFKIAKELAGKSVPATEGLVDIYVAEIVQGSYMIIMEELSEDSDIENMYYELQEHLEEQGLPIQYLSNLDTDGLELDDKMLSFISDVEDINYGYRYLGVEASDIKPDNMGRNKAGKIKAFDLDDKHR